jgi:hypothetical protein
MLLWLLTAARLAEVSEARSEELNDGIWVIPASRVKNSFEHKIALGPWGRSLMLSNYEWIFQAPKLDGPRSRGSWYRARNRVKKRMEKLAGRPIERFTPHDFRRTTRSNTKRLKVDFETAEAMLNHVKKGLERTYDTYELEEEKSAFFLKWEQEVAEIARRAGVADRLGVPATSFAKEVDVNPPAVSMAPWSFSISTAGTPAPKVVFESGMPASVRRALPALSFVPSGASAPADGSDGGGALDL